MRRSRTGFRKRGAVAVLVALSLLPVIGVIAVVLDGGILMGRRRQVQAGADSAAHAAAYSLHANYAANKGLDPQAKAKACALALAADNGLANDGATSTVTIRIPPTTGPYSGRSGYAEAVVTYNQSRYFSAIWGSSKIQVSARAVARCSDAAPTSGATAYSSSSLLLLDPSASSSLTIAGSARVTAAGGIQVNSNNSGAINASNAGYASSPSIKVKGGYSIAYGNSGTFFSTPPQTGQPAVPDPLASLATPSASGLTTRTVPPSYSATTLSPGYYPNGMPLNGGGASYTLQPGLYYVHGSLNISNGVTVNGSGVTFFVDNSGGSITYGGGAKINLTAQSSGTYAGMLMFQDRSNTSTINIANGSNTTMTGTIYAAGATAAIAGGSTNNQYGSQFIVKKLSMTNNAYWNVNTVATSAGGGTINVANQAGAGTAVPEVAVVE